MSTSTKPLPLKRPIHWILDWDGTITKKDTLNALVNIAASSKPDFPTQERWKSVVDAYIFDYTSTLRELTPNGLPTTLEDEKQLLQKLSPVEQRSLDRVYDSQIFTDLTRQDIETGAQKALESGEVSLRPGFIEFFNSISKTNSNEKEARSNTEKTPSTFHMLSVNWSRHFIHSVLYSTSIAISPTSILANELDGIDEGRASSGQISPADSTKIISSGDKLAHLNAIKNKLGGSVVYVGDSWPDIECLIGADVGICMRDEEMGGSQAKLSEALGRLGVECLRLGHGGGGDMGKRVRWVNGFDEICRWAEGV